MKFFLKSLEYKFKVLSYWLSSDRVYKESKFIRDFGVRLDLRSPRRFNEKIIHRMLYTTNTEFAFLADKVNAREHVAHVIGGKILGTITQDYDDFEDIDFSHFPKKFAIKCTHDSGSSIICEDKSQFSIAGTKRKIKSCLSRQHILHNQRKTLLRYTITCSLRRIH
ncbi:ATP-grasp fold amidoligase family protein [Yokenella regensburgei]|uniref:ATP-grasp fold amidoligase family protein n=1 Tax=Yokenella regensburgei TaxID=158877 RepID=UPI003ED9E558